MIWDRDWTRSEGPSLKSDYSVLIARTYVYQKPNGLKYIIRAQPLDDPPHELCRSLEPEFESSKFCQQRAWKLQV